MESSNKTKKQAFVYCLVTEACLNVLERSLSLIVSLEGAFTNITVNRFLIYSYFITSGIFLITLILWIVKRFGGVSAI